MALAPDAASDGDDADGNDLLRVGYRRLIASFAEYHGEGGGEAAGAQGRSLKDFGAQLPAGPVRQPPLSQLPKPQEQVKQNPAGVAAASANPSAALGSAAGSSGRRKKGAPGEQRAAAAVDAAVAAAPGAAALAARPQRAIPASPAAAAAASAPPADRGPVPPPFGTVDAGRPTLATAAAAKPSRKNQRPRPEPAEVEAPAAVGECDTEEMSQEKCLEWAEYYRQCAEHLQRCGGQATPAAEAPAAQSPAAPTPAMHQAPSPAARAAPPTPSPWASQAAFGTAGATQAPDLAAKHYAGTPSAAEVAAMGFWPHGGFGEVGGLGPVPAAAASLSGPYAGAGGFMSPMPAGYGGLGYFGQPTGNWGALNALGLLVNLGLVHPALLGAAQVQAATLPALPLGFGAPRRGVEFGVPAVGMPPIPDGADDAMVELLIRWYYSGYHTGHFAARQGR